ncbi:TVP38/TMEM64 family protein [Euzebyella marina]|uniref:TVP38/TMEM64 family membrane protein n=1 Tax=Euzebyella marina TaxID=1761453 RepID=A0A3G2L9X4_9FLAO|nr:TVP38/TMEM64 family protein [Euzebyella marina]AYN69056.1 TVP38/TMEM64 family protein [Euzebyella marina]
MNASSTKNSTSKSNWPTIVSLAILGLLVVGYFTVPSIQQFFDEAWAVLKSGDNEKTKSWVEKFGAWGPLVLILAMIAQMFLIVIPSIMLMVVSIIAYGPIWGSLIVFASVFCASSVGYFIGSLLGQGRVEKIIGHKSEKKVEKFLDDYGFWAVIITRLNPFLSNDAISFVGGILKMGYWKFIGATLIGIAPLIFFIALLGKNSDNLKTGLLWGSLASLALFLAYIWWDKKRKES